MAGSLRNCPPHPLAAHYFRDAVFGAGRICRSISIAKCMVVGRESQRLGGVRSSKSVPSHRDAWFARSPGLLGSPVCLPARFSLPPRNRAELSSPLYLMTMSMRVPRRIISPAMHCACRRACVCERVDAWRVLFPTVQIKRKHRARQSPLLLIVSEHLRHQVHAVDTNGLRD